MLITSAKLSLKKIIPVLGSILFLSACSSLPSDSLVQRLKGRGPVLVSQDNPYLAANLLIKQESHNSSVLSGFLGSKGYPAALTVTQEMFSAPTMKFFYHQGLEQYDLSYVQGNWVIKGPRKINNQAALTLLDSSKSKIENKDLLRGSFKSSSLDSPPLKSIASLKTTSPIFEPKLRGKGLVFPENPTPSTAGTLPSIESIISRFAKSSAETSPKGDVVHYVTSERETLEIIAKWYTKSNTTLLSLARANKLARSAILRPGDEIVIPVSLVKNKMRMPEEAILFLEKTSSAS